MLLCVSKLFCMKKNIIKILIVAMVLLSFQSNAQLYNGYVLTSLMNTSTATLMDTNKNTFHSWTVDAQTGYSAYLMPGGILVRAAKATGVSFTGGPICGKIQKHDYNGTKIWDYDYSTADYCTHHDICPMANGNVLVIAYERKSAAEVTAAGCTFSGEMWPDKIVEIQPTGATTGTVVWEWHAWDHLMQNTDPAKPHYVTNMVDSPQYLNVNYKATKDWMHMNGVDYNPILDQIAFSSHNLNEWYIIDHSTTTAEAAGNTGGNSGKGGQILFRWGNPAAYGATGTAILNVTHDAHWIPETAPNAGRLVGFNNKGVSASQSSVDQIITPINGYNYNRTTGAAYDPPTYTSRHACSGYSSNMGNSHQLPNGNQLICVATQSKVYEINSAGTTLWTNTFTGSVPQAFKYDSCYIFNAPPAIPVITVGSASLLSTSASTYQWYQNGVLIAGATNMTYTPTSSGVFVVRITGPTGCVYEYSKGVQYVFPDAVKEYALADKITVFPNPTTGILHIEDNNLLGKSLDVSVYDMLGHLVLKSVDSKTMDLSGLSNGTYSVMIYSEKGLVTKKIELNK